MFDAAGQLNSALERRKIGALRAPSPEIVHYSLAVARMVTYRRVVFR